MLMFEGVCMDPGQTAVLQEGKRYFLFPSGSNHYYVSNFPNLKAHKGCFQAKYFQIVEKEHWPREPAEESINLDPEKVYFAKLIWRKPGYKMIQLKDYYVKPSLTHGDFFKDINLKECCGCFPIHWFSDFKEVQQVEHVQEMEIDDFEPDLEENIPFFSESEPKISKYEQLSLFDF